MYLIAAAFEGTLIGALLTFAWQPLYATYRLAPRVSGLSALEDQQLAGLIMWIPTGMIYQLAICIVLARFLQEEERRSDAAAAALEH